MLLRISLIVSLFSMSGTCHPATTADSMKADWSRTGILYGEDHAFALTAPDGWVLDNTAGISQDIHAVFYPLGGSWEGSKVVFYAKGESKDLKAHQTVSQFMAYDSSQFAAHQRPLKVIDIAPMTLASGKTALLRRFVYSQNEVVAYIDEPGIVAMIVLTARTAADCEAALPSFKDLVRSYVFLGDNHLEKVTDFDQALNIAVDNAKRSPGKEYDSTLTRSAARWLEPEIARLARSLPDSALAPFTVLIRVGGNGRALEVLSWPNTVLAKKLEEAFSAALYPLPPAPSWWVRVGITIAAD